MTYIMELGVVVISKNVTDMMIGSTIMHITDTYNANEGDELELELYKLERIKDRTIVHTAKIVLRAERDSLIIKEFKHQSRND